MSLEVAARPEAFSETTAKWYVVSGESPLIVTTWFVVGSCASSASPVVEVA